MEAQGARIDPLAADVLEMGDAERYGVLMGLLDVFSMRYTRRDAPMHSNGIYGVMIKKYPNGISADPFGFAQHCFYALVDYADMSQPGAREVQDQIIALLAHLVDMPKSAPDGGWLHYYYLARRWAYTPAGIG